MPKLKRNFIHMIVSSSSSLLLPFPKTQLPFEIFLACNVFVEFSIEINEL